MISSTRRINNEVLTRDVVAIWLNDFAGKLWKHLKRKSRATCLEVGVCCREVELSFQGRDRIFNKELQQ